MSDKHRFTRIRLPAVTRDRAAEHRAEQVARGAHPAAARAAPAPAPAPQDLGLGPGQPLPPGEREYFERRLGTDLRPVRIHPQAAAAEAWQARAFAAGRDIGFAPGQYRPGTREGRLLLGHELAHVVEQGATGRTAIQLDGPTSAAGPELKLPQQEAEAKADAVTDGLATFGKVAKDDARVKARIIEPLKAWGAATWAALPADEKAALVTHGVVTAGTVLAPLLSHPDRARIFSDLNLAMPLGLVPYGTLTGFTYKLPSGPNGPILFDITVEGDDWLRLALGTPKEQFAPTLALDFSWRWDPATDSLSPTGAKLALGLLPGLDIQAGAGVGLSWPTPIQGPEGTPAWSMQSIPDLGPTMGPTGWGGMIMLDFTQLSLLPPWLGSQLGGAPE
jgi:hypothetical protein